MLAAGPQSAIQFELALAHERYLRKLRRASSKIRSQFLNRTFRDVSASSDLLQKHGYLLLLGPVRLRRSPPQRLANAR